MIRPVVTDANSLEEGMFRLLCKGYSLEQINQGLLDHYTIDLDILAFAGSDALRRYALRSNVVTRLSQSLDGLCAGLAAQMATKSVRSSGSPPLDYARA